MGRLSLSCHSKSTLLTKQRQYYVWEALWVNIRVSTSYIPMQTYCSIVLQSLNPPQIKEKQKNTGHKWDRNMESVREMAWQTGRGPEYLQSIYYTLLYHTILILYSILYSIIPYYTHTIYIFYCTILREVKIEIVLIFWSTVKSLCMMYSQCVQCLVEEYCMFQWVYISGLSCLAVSLALALRNAKVNLSRNVFPALMASEACKHFWDFSMGS